MTPVPWWRVAPGEYVWSTGHHRFYLFQGWTNERHAILNGSAWPVDPFALVITAPPEIVTFMLAFPGAEIIEVTQ